MMTKFLIQLSIFSLVVGAVLYAVQLFNPDYLHVHAAYVQIMSFLLTLLTFFITAKTLDTENFANGVMGGMGLRLFVALIGIMGYLYVVNHQPILFVFTAFGIYFSYLIFEIVSLLAILRRNSSNKGQ